MSNAKSGFGTTIVFGATTVTEVTVIGGLNQTRTMIDVTNQDSANACREFIGGLINGGEMNVTANFIKATYTALDTALYSTAATVVLTLAGSLGICTFTGLIADLGPPTIGIDKQVEFTMKIQCSGKPAWT